MSSSYCKIYLHLLWATFDRLPLLSPTIEAAVSEVFASKCADLSARLLCVGGVLDHVHLLLQIHPSHGVAFLAKELKGASAYFVNHQLQPGIAFRWQGSYTAYSVGKSELDRVFVYVRDQKQHHGRGTVDTSLEPQETLVRAPSPR